MGMLQTYTFYTLLGAKRNPKKPLVDRLSTTPSRSGNAACASTRNRRTPSARHAVNSKQGFTKPLQLGLALDLVLVWLSLKEYGNTLFFGKHNWFHVVYCCCCFIASFFIPFYTLEVWDQPGLQDTCSSLWQAAATLHTTVSGQRMLLGESRIQQISRRSIMCNNRQLWQEQAVSPEMAIQQGSKEIALWRDKKNLGCEWNLSGHIDLGKPV